VVAVPPHEIVIAGFGGQGVLFLGEVLARAALQDGREVTWLPAYGPEQRGGTANCTVVISDQPIGSPVVADPTILIVLNRPSLERFESRVRPGGLVIYDTTLVTRSPARADVEAIGLPATDLATAVGAPRVANVVLLGALLTHTSVVSTEAVLAALGEMVADAAARTWNAAALEQGRLALLTQRRTPAPSGR
jgi:2-oxoglutarate ferredoxin oxidoreductase subunit gamma